ncbi:hypothetical protein DVH24_002731 [Malus domestica]|uniref:Uncharacterized protein n=1 Tax=Malus domestica TaxID=3750 RepID=A0A498KAV3_MALDO|nr:hypothetical protein DVH24_002731 [Malus domestica]
MQQRLRPRLTNDRLIIPPESSSLPLSKAQIYETVTAGFPTNFRRSMPELDLNPRVFCKFDQMRFFGLA